MTDQRPDPGEPDPLREAVALLEKVREELLDLKHNGPNVAVRAFAREALLRLEPIIEDMY
jgi:hypothetical protein